MLKTLKLLLYQNKIICEIVPAILFAQLINISGADNFYHVVFSKRI